MDPFSNGNVVIAMNGGISSPAGLAKYNPTSGVIKYLTTVCSGYQFNSPNDVVVVSDSSIWFADPQYGCEQGFKPRPTMGNWVWRFHLPTGAQRLLIDGFLRPNSIALSSDQMYDYVSDSG
jgi:gluconolactonase